MSNSICQLLNESGAKQIYCDENECKIKINDVNYVVSFNDFTNCFKNRCETQSSNHGVRMKRGHMTAHQRNVYEKRA
jgi:hypothetical protein